MAALTAQQLPLSGLQPAYAAAAVGGDTAPIGARLVLHIRNGGASSVTATIATPAMVGDLEIEDAAQVIPAAGEAFVPMAAVYRAANGRAAITYTAVTDVTVAVLQLP